MIDPVQEFIGQSRRTRDLWASSFLVSWVTGQAMQAVIEMTGDKDAITFPYVKDDPLLQAIAQSLIPTPKNNSALESEELPKIATLPNRFTAVIGREYGYAEINKKVVEKVKQKWLDLAQAVYKAFIAKQDKAGRTQDIWDRQISNFWQIKWILGESEHLLDLRKGWNNNTITQEGGKHCTMMGDWQELSGCFKSADQDKFWQAIRKQTTDYTASTPDFLNLRRNERLCAIAFVKRFFYKAIRGGAATNHRLGTWRQ